MTENSNQDNEPSKPSNDDQWSHPESENQRPEPQLESQPQPQQFSDPAASYVPYKDAKDGSNQSYTNSKSYRQNRKKDDKESLGRVFSVAAIKSITWSAVVSTFTGLAFFFSIAGMIFALALGGAVIGDSSDNNSQYSHYTGSKEEDSQKILMLNINGVIVGENEAGGGLFSAGGTDGYYIKDVLADAATDSTINGVILKMSTPGGTIYGSQAIADGVEIYKKSGNPIVAYVSSISASGGMLAMAGVDKIYADHGTLVGSIGVIFGPFTYYNTPVSEGSFLGSVETKDGIEKEYITAGKGKDVGNPYRRITDEERQNFQESVDNSYKEFVKHVADKRSISKDEIIDNFGARLFDEISAEKAGLIDGTRNRDEVYREISDLANININNMEVVFPTPSAPGVLSSLFSKLGLKDTPKSSKACIQETTLISYEGDVTKVLCSTSNSKP